MPTRYGLGPAGECICPACGYITPHSAGFPCYNITCPMCGTKLTRKQ
ncbi:MAG: hypothetical protein KKB31_04885 [Nanoarchaeota archaeon]|nr:hypothetical protein [Nanoarchaeota archaeon]